MEDLEHRAISTCPLDIRPPFWKRYVDDALSAIKSGKTEDFMTNLNQIDERGNIKFTNEEEQNGTLPYLDINIHHPEDGRMTTTVYRKDTHADQYLQFESAHPLHQKLEVIRSLIDRKDTVITLKEDKIKKEKNLVRKLHIGSPVA